MFSGAPKLPRTVVVYCFRKILIFRVLKPEVFMYQAVGQSFRRLRSLIGQLPPADTYDG